MKRTLLLLAVVAWILIPTGTPDDLITIPLIKWLGIELYILLLVVVLALLWYNKITFKKISDEMKKQLKKVKSWF